MSQIGLPTAYVTGLSLHGLSLLLLHPRAGAAGGEPVLPDVEALVQELAQVLLVAATDRRVGKWSNLWQPSATMTPSDYSFSIIELHLNPKGEGEGRGVVTGKVVVDSAAKTIALDNYAALPVVLKAVKRQSGN